MNPIHVIWVDIGTWSVRCAESKSEIMKFNLGYQKLGEIRWKVEQFLKDTQFDGRRVQIMTGPDDAGSRHAIPC